jgi:4-hydroxy-3-methylbut-2-enyl diphosphate reductase
VKELTEFCDLVLVVGSINSSNSNRLKELAERKGVTSYLIDDAGHINPDWLNGVETIGLTAGASAPEKLVKDVIAWLKKYDNGLQVESLDGEPENMVFALPKELRLVQTS